MLSLKEKALALKRQCIVLVLAVKHPDTPWFVRLVGSFTLLYALSPIDLIPDFIPVFGLLDDLIIVPIGIWLTIRLIPKPIWEECQQEVLRRELGKPAKDWRGIILIVSIWIVLALLGWWLWSIFFLSDRSKR